MNIHYFHLKSNSSRAIKCLNYFRPLYVKTPLHILSISPTKKCITKGPLHINYRVMTLLTHTLRPLTNVEQHAVASTALFQRGNIICKQLCYEKKIPLSRPLRRKIITSKSGIIETIEGQFSGLALIPAIGDSHAKIVNDISFLHRFYCL